MVVKFYFTHETKYSSSLKPQRKLLRVKSKLLMQRLCIYICSYRQPDSDIKLHIHTHLYLYLYTHMCVHSGFKIFISSFCLHFLYVLISHSITKKENKSKSRLINVYLESDIYIVMNSKYYGFATVLESYIL